MSTDSTDCKVMYKNEKCTLSYNQKRLWFWLQWKNGGHVSIFINDNVRGDREKVMKILKSFKFNEDELKMSFTWAGEWEYVQTSKYITKKFTIEFLRPIDFKRVREMLEIEMS